MPDQKAFGGGASGTVLHPFVLVAMLVAIALILFLPRKHIIVPFILSAILIPLPQQLYVAGQHVFVLRILILVGWVRILWALTTPKTEIVSGKFNIVDKMVLLWALSRAVAIVLLYKEMPALTNQVGFLWDSLGAYFLLRFVICDKDDVTRCIKAFAGVVLILAITMANEKLRSQNVFGFLGGLPISPDVREGAIRAQGSFATSILAGSFAATLLPLFVWLWQSRRSRTVAIVGIAGSTGMVLTSASSTPLLAYLAVIIGLCFWPLRGKMRVIRWVIVIALITCHLLMKAPVWFLIAHVDLVAGNSGYHRAMLIDTFMRHFWDWCLVGTKDTGNWGIDMWDLSNQFVAEGEVGGLATFIFFVAMISRSFGRIGNSRKRVRGNSGEQWFLWLLGVALFSHCVAYFGISYFDQTRVAWFALLAMISAATAPILAKAKMPQQNATLDFADSHPAYATASPSVGSNRELITRGS